MFLKSFGSSNIKTEHQMTVSKDKPQKSLFQNKNKTENRIPTEKNTTQNCEMGADEIIFHNFV